MFNKDKKPKRFTLKEREGIGTCIIEILVDTKTGVNYLVTQSPYGGITPLLDENGNIVIDKESIEIEHK